MKKFVFILLFTLFGVLTAEAQQQPSNLVGQPILPFSTEDMKGAHFASESLKGKVLLLNLWATSCKPCILEMPALNELKQDYEGKDVLFISLATDDKATIKKFLKKHSFDFTILPGSLLYMMQYGTVLPQTILVDKAGIIREARIGTLPVDIQKDDAGENTYTFKSDELRTKIDELLAE